MDRVRENEASRRVGLAVLAALSVIGVAARVPVTGAGGTTSLAAAAEQQKSDLGVPHDDAYLPPHDHNDPRTKNEVSRGLAVGEEAVDPTTAAQRAAAEAYVARERALPDPKLGLRAGVPGPRRGARRPLRDGRRLLHPHRRRQGVRALLLQGHPAGRLPAAHAHRRACPRPGSRSPSRPSRARPRTGPRPR
ncbi:hypothetical protein G5V59_20495 [Nocardioides sp. W3-2-3]|uniref:hypothetical protein n=1 Tax=Nocardioides convexus TaxID=2712224 RepID=UPI002418B452|nr:hypothetical protein [Nocardioides convexus]NHA01410.1 hypothetical protein [Nocardioides convexus]